MSFNSLFTNKGRSIPDFYSHDAIGRQKPPGAHPGMANFAKCVAERYDLFSWPTRPVILLCPRSEFKELIFTFY
jgi:hypothetical protein